MKATSRMSQAIEILKAEGCSEIYLIKSQIQFQIQQIDKLLRMYCQLLKECREKEPDLVEITAIASVLHSFYNGLENIFEIIAKRIDKGTEVKFSNV